MPEADSELTARQRAVIERIERRMPIKTIAAELGISATRVNQHVRAMKDLYGVDNLGQLIETFRAGAEPPSDHASSEQGEYPPLPKDALLNDQVPTSAQPSETAQRNDSAEFAFSDALNFSVEAPWASQANPAVVPGMLDGHNFVTARLLAMVGVAVGLMSLLVLVLTSFLSLGEMLDGRAHVPEINSTPASERGGEENYDGESGQSGRVENP